MYWFGLDVEILSRGDHFRFGLVFIKKSNQTDLFFFEKKNETEPKPGQTDWFRFGSVFLGKKPVQTGLARFFRFWLGFFRFGSVLARFFQFDSVLARFGSVFFRFFVGFGSVRFFWFFAYKTETEPAGFFKNLIGLIGFFFGSVFLVIFFLVFSV